MTAPLGEESNEQAPLPFVERCEDAIDGAVIESGLACGALGACLTATLERRTATVLVCHDQDLNHELDGFTKRFWPPLRLEKKTKLFLSAPLANSYNPESRGRPIRIANCFHPVRRLIGKHRNSVSVVATSAWGSPTSA